MTIRFVPEMIAAIRSGKKVETRRPVKRGETACRFGLPGDILTVEGENLRLRIESVHRERLHQIDAFGIFREGIREPRCGCEVCARSIKMCPADASAHLLSFASLWDSMYGAGSWERNPEVWVISFAITYLGVPIPAHRKQEAHR